MRRFALALILTFPLAAHAELNDTGVSFCGAFSSGIFSPCVGTEPAGQDFHYGRDAQAAAGTLVKIGGGEAGFDFTAIDASGNPTTPSSGANPHACVKDNLTGLIWEVKTNDGGLRDKDWTYTWYDSVHNYGGYAGYASGGICMTNSRCDTEKYVADLNATALCGYTDWRMPTVKELEGIAHLGRNNPAIDPTYFPNTPGLGSFWSGSPHASSDYAWYVNFYDGYAYYYSRSYYYSVRLVRSGQ